MTATTFTAKGTIQSPLHSHCEGTVVSVDAHSRRDTYMVTESKNAANGRWWVYFLRATGWVSIASINDECGQTPTPEQIVRYVDGLLA